MLTMSEIYEYLSNSTGSRGEKHVINYPNLSERVRLKRKRKLEIETTSPKKRRRTTEVSKNSFALKNVKTSTILWKHSFIDSESLRFSFGR